MQLIWNRWEMLAVMRVSFKLHHSDSLVEKLQLRCSYEEASVDGNSRSECMSVDHTCFNCKITLLATKHMRCVCMCVCVCVYIYR